MHTIQIHNETRPISEPLKVSLYDTFFLRFKGLMFRKFLGKEEGILLDETQESRTNAGIHMLFMRFDIAVVWVNSHLEVVDRQLARKWNLMYIPSAPARYILEIHPEHLEDFQNGDRLVFEQI